MQYELVAFQCNSTVLINHMAQLCSLVAVLENLFILQSSVDQRLDRLTSTVPSDYAHMPLPTSHPNT